MSAGLVTAVVSVTSVLVAGFGFLARLLWTTSSKWTTAALNITALTQQLATVVNEKETDHNRIEARVDRIEQRVHVHEQWHSQRGRFVL